MRRKIIPYNKQLKYRARYLRNNSTSAEITLWKYLKGKQMLGFDFHRQKPINNYIVDFYCCEIFLAIEIDGTSHEYSVEYDKKRTTILNSLGVSVIRFSNNDVIRNTDGVVFSIKDWIVHNVFIPYLSIEGKTM